MSEANNSNPENGSPQTPGVLTETQTPSPISFTSHDSAAAFALIRPEIEAIPIARAQPINSDVGFAVQTALWMVSALDGIRPQLASASTDYDLSILDRMRAAALSLNYLQSRIRILLRSNNSPLVHWLTKRRAIYHNDANGLVLRDLMDGAPLDELRHTNNYELLGYDVMGLSDLLLEHYDKFDGKCMTSKEELLDARSKANELFTELGTKQFGPKADAALKLLRRQCFVLLNDLWADIESFVRYARRRHKDADQYIRSLYPARGGRKPSKREADDDPIDAEEADQSVATGEDLAAAEPLGFDAEAINQTIAAAAVNPATPARAGFPGAPALRAKVEE